jgi:hypothetical protein
MYTDTEHRKLQECDDALFGTWDMSLRKRMPGIVEKYTNLSIMMKIVGALASFTVLHDLGVPTQVIFPVLGKIVASIFRS